MENATKALYMAAEILIGIMITSIAVYLFSTMGRYVEETTEKVEEKKILQFNQLFLKYYGTTAINGNNPEPIKCTIHDIVGVANLARKTNVTNGFEGVEEPSDGSLYIRIDLQIGSKLYKHLEMYEQNQLVEIIKENDLVQNPSTGEPETKYFICKDEPKISNVTKKVNYMKFVEI